MDMHRLDTPKKILVNNSNHTVRESADNELTIKTRILNVWRVLKLTVGFLVLLTILVYFKQLPPGNPPRHESQALSVAVIPNNCQLLPTHGLAYDIEPSIMKRTDVLYSGLQIANLHDHSMVAVLTDKLDSKQFYAVSIFPTMSVQFSVPVGQYGMKILVGSQWCNLETGFSDGAQVVVDGGISVQVGMTTALEFHGMGINPLQIALAYSSFRPTNQGDARRPTEVIGVGELELLQSDNGHYFSSGTINDAPVIFLIDTGATNVSISSKLADRAGIRKCQSHHVMTANGSVNACMATVPEITFGAFQLTNVDVTVMPNMSDEALLGMNVLSNFRLEQVDKVLRISLR